MGTLDGVTLDGEAVIHNNRVLAIENGLTVNGGLYLDNSFSSISGLSFRGAGIQTLDGTGEVVFGLNNTGSRNQIVLSGGATGLTIDSGVTVRSGMGAGTIAGGLLTNRGTIAADNSKSLTVSGTDWINEGTLRAVNNGTVILQGTLNNQGKTLTFDIASGGRLSLSGIIQGGMITPLNSQPLVIDGFGTVDGVTLDGNIVIPNGRTLSIENGLTVNGKLYLDNNSNSSSSLSFNGEGIQTLDGTGEVVFGLNNTGSRNQIVLSGGATGLTIDSGVTVRSGMGAGTIAGGLLTNRGTIAADNSKSLTVSGTDWINEGTLRAVNNGTVILQGTIVTNGLGTLDGVGGVISLRGTLDNMNQTLLLDASSRGLVLGSSGRIVGGVIDTANGHRLEVTGLGTLDGVTLDGEAVIHDRRTLAIENGLTVNGKLYLDNNSNSISGLSFRGEGIQTLDGTGEVVFGLNNNGSRNQIVLSGGATGLTIDSGVTVRSGMGAGTIAGGLLTNRGTIAADNSKSLTVSGTDWINEGTLRAVNNGTVILQGTLNNQGKTLTFDIASGGRLSLSGIIQGGMITPLNSQPLVIDGFGTVDGVTLDGNIVIPNGRTLSIENGLTVNGKLYLDNNSNSSSSLSFNGEGIQTLDGTGEVVFGLNNNGSRNQIVLSGGATGLTIDSGVTVRSGMGAGTIAGGLLTNRGTIAADNSKSLTVSGTDWINEGTLRAVNNGTVILQGTLNNQGKTLTFDIASGGRLSLSGIIQGGMITPLNSQPLVIDGFGTVDGVTLDGNIVIPNGRTLSIENGLTVNGKLYLDNNSNSSSSLSFNGEGIQTLDGTGEVVFGLNNTGSRNQIVLSGGATGLTIDSGVTVRSGMGAGTIAGGLLTNRGTIAADNSKSLTVSGTDWINEGTLRAVNNGTVILQGTIVTNGLGTLDGVGGVISLRGTLDNMNQTLLLDASSRGLVLGSSGRIVGGVIDTANGHRLEVTGLGTLDGVTLDGEAVIHDRRTLAIENGLTVNGKLYLDNNSNSISGLSFRGEGIQTLDGTGEVVFGLNNNGSRNQIVLSGGATGLTIDSGVTVRSGMGAGTIAGGLLTNRGTIAADNSKSLTVSGTDWINEGTLRAVNNGTVILQGTLNNQGKTLTFDIASGGRLSLSGIIQGGMITPLNSQPLVIDGFGTVDGVTLDGNIVIPNGRTLSIENGLTVNGKLYLDNNSNSSSSLSFNGEGIQTLDGTGEVVFGLNNTGSRNQIVLSGGATGLTIDSGVTVRSGMGAGTIAGGLLTNRGTIAADNSKSLTVSGTDWINEGTLRAVNNGTVILQGTIVTNGLGTLDGVGGVISLRGTLDNMNQTLLLDASSRGLVLGSSGRIVGGVIDTANGHRLEVTGLGTLDGVTLDGEAVIHDRRTLAIENGLTVNGKLYLDNNSNSSSSLSFNGEGIQTLDGTGEVVFGLNNTGSRNQIVLSGGATGLTIDSGVTVRSGTGDGTINGGLLTNRGTITADNSKRLTVSGTDWINEGTLRAVNNGTVILQGTIVTNGLGTLDGVGGVISLRGTLDNMNQTLLLDASSRGLVLGSSGRIVGGVIDTANGHRLEVTGLGTLDGVTLDGEAVIHDRRTLAIENGLTVNGKLYLDNNSNSSSSLSFNGEGIQTLDGTGEVVFGLNNTGSRNQIVLSGGATGLTIDSGVTVRSGMGAGTIAGGLLTNRGTIAADNSKSLTVSGTDWINEGTLRAVNNGTVILQGTIVTNGLGTLDGVGGVISLRGTLDNMNQTLLLDASSRGLVLGSSGRIVGGVIDTANGHRLEVTGLGTLDGVTLDGEAVIHDRRTLAIENGLTVNGKLYLDNNSNSSSSLSFNGEGIQTLDGTGEVVFGLNNTGSRNQIVLSGGATGLTIDSGVTVRSGMGAGTIAGGLLTNRGTIAADNSKSLTVSGTDWINEGTLRAVNNGTVILQGTIVTNGLGTLDGVGGVISLRGTLDNMNQTLLLDASSRGLVLGSSGRIVGGVIDTANGHRLEVTGLGTLDGVTLDGEAVIHDRRTLAIENGLTVNGKLYLDNNSNSISGLSFRGEGIQTLDGTGEVVFGLNNTGSRNQIVLSGGATGLTIDSGVTVRSGMGAGTIAGGLLTNRGTIAADNSKSLTVSGTDWINEGTLRAVNNGTVRLGGNLTHSGTFHVGSSGTINVLNDVLLTILAKIQIDIGGTSPGQFGRIAVTGNVQLSGILDLNLANGFAATLGDEFEVMVFGSRSGSFSSFIGLDIGNGLMFEIDESDVTRINAVVGSQ